MMRTLLLCLSLGIPLAAQSSRSVAELKQLTEKEPQNGSAWFELGDALMAAGQPGQAVPAFQQARQNGYRPPAASIRILNAWVAAKNVDNAAAALERMAQAGFPNASAIETPESLAPLRAHPKYAAAIESIKRNAAPCEYDKTYRQFDFWVGNWAVRDAAGKLQGTNKIEKVLNGCLLVENWTSSGSTGKSMNFYDRAQKKWRQVWIGSDGGVLNLAGEIGEKGSMVFSGTTRQKNGAEQLEKLTFSPLKDERVHQFWQQSADGGKTWKTAFEGFYAPLKDESARTTLASSKTPAGCAAPEHRQLDFWVGKWIVNPPGTPNPAPPKSDVLKIADGCAIFENWMPPTGGDGKSFNFFDRADGKWHQVWVAQNSSVLDLAGSFDGKWLRYEGARNSAGGALPQKLGFTRLDDGRVRQLWEQSSDGGKTWSVAFDGYYSRRD